MEQRRLMLSLFMFFLGFSGLVDAKTRRVLIDTDVNSDDIYALLYFLKQNRSEIDVKVERLSVEDLSSRLTLNANGVAVGPLLLSDSFITLMDTNDFCAIPQQLKDQVTERYSGARRAILKTGGDFPFLSRSDEVNLHLQLHLRHVGVEPKPDLVQDISGNGNAGSSANDKNAGGGFDDDPPEDRGNSGNDSETDQSGPSDAGSNKLDEQFLSNVRLCLLALETAPLLVHGSTLLVLQLCVATLCTCWKPLMMV